MSLNSALSVVLMVSLIALAASIIYILLKVSRTLSNANKLIDDVSTEIGPILAKIQMTVDEVNLELGRVDEIVRVVQDVTDKVQLTASLTQEVISSPLIKLASFSAGTRKAMSNLMGREK